MNKTMFSDELVASLSVSVEEFHTIFKEDNIEKFRVIYDNLKPLEEVYARAVFHGATRIQEFIESKSILVVNVKRHFHILTTIVLDYIKDFLGSNDGFDWEGVVEVSYPELQELIHRIQKLEDEDNYDDDETLDPIWTYIKPLKVFYDLVQKANGELNEKVTDNALEYKYYDRFRVEILGLNPLVK